MTKEEFVKSLSRGAAAALESGLVVVLPCRCGHVHCQKWATVANNQEAINLHKTLYGPPEE